MHPRLLGSPYVQDGRGGHRRHRPVVARRTLRRLLFESLEQRFCLSAFYDFHVVAQTGSQLSKIEDFVSVNDHLQVSFVAEDVGSGRSGVYVGDRVSSPRLVSFPSTTGPGRLYGRAASISDAADGVTHQVAARDLVIGDASSGSLLRRWASTGDVSQRVDVAASRHLFTLPEPEDFDSLLSLMDINDHGQVVFIGLDSSSGTTIHKLRVRSSMGEAFAGNSIEIGDFPASAGLRPQISNTAEVVFRSPSSQSIFKTDQRSGMFRRIAGGQEGFVAAAGGLPAVGRSPGISDDGRVVVFFGNHPADNEPGDGLGGGQGVFASILKPGGNPNGGASERILVRLAGIPGELGRDASGLPMRLTDFATESTVSGAATTDSRVGVAGTLAFKKDSASLLYVTFLANDPRHGGRETLWRTEFTATIDARGEMQVSVAKPEAVIGVGETVVDTFGASLGTVADLEVYDPITRQGDIAFWTKLDTGGQAVVLSSRLRNPVLVVPGIAGTFANDDYLHWLMNRGEHPDNLRIDPLAGFYNDIIATLKSAGYVEGEDLFVANYDWRVLPGPIDPGNLSSDPADWNFDGRILNLAGRANQSEVFEYGVDYFFYWLKHAVEAWHRKHPRAPLPAVDVIAHSTGGLVARTYIQSDAYGTNYAASFGSVALPKIDKFVMVGVPNRGAAKAWNPLHDNFVDDEAFRFVLSKVIKGAYEKQETQPIFGPDRVIAGETDPKAFIEHYVPTIRSLLATYDFLGTTTAAPVSVNNRPGERNNLVLDLNAGLDAGGIGDPNRFADLVGSVVNVYGTNAKGTPRIAALNVGSNTILGEDIFSFRDTVLARRAADDEEWYTLVTCQACGDGTVPLESSLGQFSGDARIKLLPFTQGGNTLGTVGHTELLSNPDVQAAILRELGSAIERSKISTDQARKGWQNLVNIVLDPVEGFVVDGQGRRLGYTSDTGPLTEIPDSVYFGEGDGMGWIFGAIVPPLTLQLAGLGAEHFAEVSGFAGVTPFGLESRGYLAAGETTSLPVVQVVNYPPSAIADFAEANHGSTVVIDVLANDSDPDGDALELVALDTTLTRGAAEITPQGNVAYTPPAGYEGSDSLVYTVSDGRGGTASAEVRIAVPGRPRIVAVWPDENDQVATLSSVRIDFSHAMDPGSASNPAHYQLLHETLGPLPIAAVTYGDQDGSHRATISLAVANALTPGRVHVRVDGRALRTATGQAISGSRDDVLTVTPENNGLARISRQVDGGYHVSEQTSLPGFDKPQSIAVGDFNADGISDMVAASAATGELVFYFGRGQGGFEPATTITIPLTVTEVESRTMQVYVADWNVDSVPDVLVYDNVFSFWGANKRVHILLNDRQGGFRNAPETPIPLSDDDAGGILAVADFTGDGLPDVAVSGPAVDGSRFNYTAKGSVAIYAKDQFLGYTLADVISTGRSEWYPDSAVIADFNGDGRADLAVATTGYYVFNPGTVLYLSAPTGLAPAVELEYDRIGGGRLAAGDFTGDGRADLAILHDYYRNSYDVHDGNVISVLAGDGQGNFAALPNQSLGRRALDMAGAGDLNGDGKLDLLFTAAPWPASYVGGFPALDHFSTWSLLGDGRGNFSPATPDPVPIEPLGLGGVTSVGLTDVNGDGLLDAVMGSGEASVIRVLLNDRTGALRSAPQTLLTGPLLDTHPETQFRRLVDVNSDGLLDLLVLDGESTKQLIVYLNTPAGQLEPRFLLPIPGSGGYGWLQTGDMNADGLLDVVVASDEQGVMVLLGQGNGQFTPVTSEPVKLAGFDYLDTKEPGVIADVNQDGKPDLLVTVADLQGYYVTATGWAVYFGDGTGKLFFNRNTFVPFPEGYDFPVAAYAPYHPDYTPLIRDFDFDGRVDFLVATIPSGDSSTHLTVYRGNGNGTFSPGTTTVQPDALRILGYAAHDFNGDGKLDVLGYSDDEVAIFLGDGAGHYQLLPGATDAMQEFRLSPSGSRYRFSDLAVGDFNGDGFMDVALTKLSVWFSDLNEDAQVVSLFLNDGTGRFSEGLAVPVSAIPRSLQTVANERWIEAGRLGIVPSLWPVKLTSPAGLPQDRQQLTGTGPANSAVHVTAGGASLGQTHIGADGQWSYTLSPGLPVGYHALRLFATDAEGQVSAETQATISIQSAAPSWQNSPNRFDVDGNGTVTANDVLVVVNELNGPRFHDLTGVLQVPPPPGTAPPFFDVNGDGLATPGDVLEVINYLNGLSAASGEGEIYIPHADIPAGLDASSPSTASALRHTSAPHDASLRYFPESSPVSPLARPRPAGARPPAHVIDMLFSTMFSEHPFSEHRFSEYPLDVDFLAEQPIYTARA